MAEYSVVLFFACNFGQAAPLEPVHIELLATVLVLAMQKMGRIPILSDAH